ncbi:MAG TPA: transposase [Chloroflexota bacterium]|nr:transposase [Chloroflexota bacterium]
MAEVLPLLDLHGLSTGTSSRRSLGCWARTRPGCALGFWAAARDVWPAPLAETCWLHRIANVLDKLPTRLQPKAKRARHAMLDAENRTACLAELGAFVAEYAAKYPTAVASLTADQDRLLTHVAFPAEHRGHLPTTSPIESTRAPVKLRQRVTKGAGSRTAGLTLAFKLLTTAEQRWRRLNAPHLVAQVRAGVRFRDGLKVERDTATAAVQTAA